MKNGCECKSQEASLRMQPDKIERCNLLNGIDASVIVVTRSTNGRPIRATLKSSGAWLIDAPIKSPPAERPSILSMSGVVQLATKNLATSTTVREAMSEVYVNQDEQVTTKKAPHLQSLNVLVLQSSLPPVGSSYQVLPNSPPPRM